MRTDSDAISENTNEINIPVTKALPVFEMESLFCPSTHPVFLRDADTYLQSLSIVVAGLQILPTAIDTGRPSMEMLDQKFTFTPEIWR